MKVSQQKTYDKNYKFYTTKGDKVSTSKISSFIKVTFWLRLTLLLYRQFTGPCYIVTHCSYK